MNYELALKLKNAGWVYKNRLYGMILPGDVMRTLGHTEQDCKDGLYVPELEELIEACGGDFGNLKGWIYDEERRFTAVDSNGREFKGQTPLVAVANLWLALHEKH